MIPTHIRVDPTYVDENGIAIDGALIYLKYIKVHPLYYKKVYQGLKEIYPNATFTAEIVNGNKSFKPKGQR